MHKLSKTNEHAIKITHKHANDKNKPILEYLLDINKIKTENKITIVITK